MNGYKYTQADGTDHYTGTINYRENIGKEMVHPCPDTDSRLKTRLFTTGSSDVSCPVSPVRI